MSRIFVRILWGIVGVILIVGGIFCFTQPAAVLLAMSALLGVSMLLCGVVDLIIFARGAAADVRCGRVSVGWHSDGTAVVGPFV